ncbi:Uma2 family endonuclease [Leptothermofonsia sichuanensis E412]|uniref:Uma2 family endonuclease n=1 Tax=Leptothermofonsia sichuanensis TaxID=2917832 RepID=UPI001CA77057|nr:Uma2 family endonuclease [Leptothermofonsia sichuanensis]QZZ21541.1 Uma2 family endonuclease [Leptothermofonsia sichuanensis E412]
MTMINLVKVPIKSIDLSPGSHLSIPDVTWEQYEALLEELGEKRRSPKINYYNGTLELMSPLPKHERWKRLIVGLVESILKAQKRPWEPLGSTTFKRKSMAAGLEPDDCFYIQNYRVVIGKERIDLDIDPPPDLAIEADLTSQTQQETYEALDVPELWIYGQDKLKIYVLRNGKYEESAISPTFPELPVAEIVSRTISQAQTLGYSQTLLEFEAWLSNQETIQDASKEALQQHSNR